MKSGCVSDSTRAAGRRLAEAYQTALANFGSQARQPSPVPLFERKWFLTPFPPPFPPVSSTVSRGPVPGHNGDPRLAQRCFSISASDIAG